MATKSVEITFDKLNSLFKALEELDSDKKDYQITMKEFNLIKDKQDIIRNLIGNRKSDDWGQFKQSFIDFQSQYNITWTSSQGQGGPLNLNYIYLPYELGLSVAQDIINSKEIVEKKEYDLHEILKKNYLQIMYKYIDKNYSYIDLSDFKEGFKSYSKGNFSFKFKKGKGAYFKKTINEFVYLNKKESQDEIALGNLIVNEIKDILNLEKLDHIQNERKGGKFQNYDFIGFKYSKTPFKDELEIYSFELKASNKIVSISEAISQATGYKSTSNYVYIVIPMFDKKLFHDEDRFETFKSLCLKNGLGIFTIDIDTQKNTILDVYEVLSPIKNEIANYDLYKDILETNNLEYCRMCNRYILMEDERKGCGWRIKTQSETRCAKIMFEEKLMQ